MDTSLLKDKVVLIADDYSICLELLSLSVVDAGATPLTASDGSQCIEIVKKHHVDMILMDRCMPVMDGIEATKAIRVLPQGKDIVIIGITVSDDENEKMDCIQAGMNLIYPKLTLNTEALVTISAQFFGSGNTSTHSLATPPIESAQSVSQSNNIKAYDDPVIIDYDKTLSEFGNDSELLDTLIEKFNTIIHSQLSLMLQALRNEDFECIRTESHSIKGGAANLFALPLSNAAQSLELACKKHASKETIADLVDNLTAELHSFDTFVKNRTHA